MHPRLGVVGLGRLLPPERIRAPLSARTKLGVIDELLDVLPFADEDRRDAARDAILERESEFTTGLGRGVAIPHGRCDAVDEQSWALGVSPAPVDFDAVDGLPCDLVFLCVSNPAHAAAHA